MDAPTNPDGPVVVSVDADPDLDPAFRALVNLDIDSLSGAVGPSNLPDNEFAAALDAIAAQKNSNPEGIFTGDIP